MTFSKKTLTLGIVALGLAGFGTASLAKTFGTVEASGLDSASIVKNGKDKKDGSNSGKANMRGSATVGLGF